MVFPSQFRRRIRISGFTLLELLVVVAILAIIAALGFTAIQRYGQQQRYYSAIVTVFETLREARSETLGAADDQQYGVRVTDIAVTKFEGGMYSVSDPSNEVHAIDGVTIALALNGGGADVVFSRQTGTTTQYGTVKISSQYSNASTTIEILGTGVIQELQ